MADRKPTISEWRSKRANADLGEPDRARWVDAQTWACEVSWAKGYGWAWIVWDSKGAKILAEGTATSQGEAERACDAAAARWYSLPTNLRAVP